MPSQTPRRGNGAAIAQCDGQVRRLRRNVQAGSNADPLQRLALDEILADNLQHLHGLVRPLDALFSQVGEIDVLDVAVDLRGCSRHASPVAL